MSNVKQYFCRICNGQHDKEEKKMSTRSSIAHGKDFHFYTDLTDPELECVYLRIDGCDKCGSSLTTEIPLHIWEVIREYSSVDFSLKDQTDEDILKKVVDDVDKRIEEYNLASDKNDRTRWLISFCGSMVFGVVEDPRENQIKCGVEYFTKRRDKVKEIFDQMQEHTMYITKSELGHDLER